MGRGRPGSGSWWWTSTVGVPHPSGGCGATCRLLLAACCGAGSTPRTPTCLLHPPKAAAASGRICVPHFLYQSISRQPGLHQFFANASTRPHILSYISEPTVPSPAVDFELPGWIDSSAKIHALARLARALRHRFRLPRDCHRLVRRARKVGEQVATSNPTRPLPSSTVRLSSTHDPRSAKHTNLTGSNLIERR